jgi:hypothetical protein
MTYGATAAFGGVGSGMDDCVFLQETAKIAHSGTMTILKGYFIELVLNLPVEFKDFKINDYAWRFNGNDG